MKLLHPTVGVLVGILGIFGVVSLIGGVIHGFVQAVGFAPFLVAGAWATRSPRFAARLPDLERRYRVTERYVSMIAMLFLGLFAATLLTLFSPAGFADGGWGVAQIILFVLSVYVVGCSAIIKIGLAKRLKALRALNAKQSGSTDA